MSKFNATCLVWLCFFLQMGKYRNHCDSQTSYLADTVHQYLSSQRSASLSYATLSLLEHNLSQKFYPQYQKVQ